MATGSMLHYGDSRFVRVVENGVVVHGSTEPILSILDRGGFPIEDLFLLGFNDKCGTVVLPSEERARFCAAVLEPAHRVRVSRMGHPEHPNEWKVDYDLRDPDGSVPSHLVTGIWLKDGEAPGGERQVMRDGRWLDGRRDY